MPNLTELEICLRREISRDRLSADLEALARWDCASGRTEEARAAADHLRRRLEESGLETTVHELDDSPGCPEEAELEVRAPIVVGSLRGAVEPERFVLLSGHYCSWHCGATDNAGSITSMLETARILAKHKEVLRRSFRVAFWPGHSQGRYSGSTWYADRFWEDLHDNCVLHVNVDNIAASRADVLQVLTTPNAGDFAVACARDALGEEVSTQHTVGAGDLPFSRCGVSTVTLVSRVLMEAASMSLLATLQVASSPILPLRQAAAARQVREALESYQAEAGDRFDLGPVIARARDLEAFSTELDDLLDQIRGAPSAERLARVANQGLMELSRALVTVGFTANGPFEHDLAVSQKVVPLLEPARRLKDLDPDADETRYLVTELTRGRNKVAFYLRHALAAADETMVALRKALMQRG